MVDCYWHIESDEPSSSTSFGTHKFNRLPFGIFCASDASQLMIERHLGDIKVAIAIHEDLIISAVLLSEHDKTFRDVLERASIAILSSTTRKYS